ncbi:solute carrier organic anion transporter family member 4A1-like [Acanthaster planci]|uniref:Solute carrier organic anion transporter family member n=1 Tax=Acanthaster planci TaxID=133434 RepID=A0A8B7Y8Y6_ACAPL|nr:solute carrier organic anion transporter family member 4A1-like [Acanthaster planci]
MDQQQFNQMGEGDSDNLAPGIARTEVGVENPCYRGMDDQTGTNGIPRQAEVEIKNPSKQNASSSPDAEEDALQDEDFVQYGWLSFRPSWLQFINNPKGYLVFLCWFALVQGMTVNGFVYVITSTLERRFVLPSVQSGSISSCYDFSVMIIIVFVTYFGESSHKPKWLGTGAFIFVLGSLTFMLPHFITPDYDVTPSDVDTCDPSRQEPGQCLEGDSSLRNYFWMFVAAQALHGIGASPLYTLGVTYLDENVKPAYVSIYVGIFQAITTLGPAVGYLVGGLFLGIYTDFPKQPPGGISDDHPLWVGAWWLGSVMPACLGILVVLPLYGFPRYLKDHKKVAALRVAENQKGTDFKSRSDSEGLVGGIKDFPIAIWTLIKNAPFMFINLGLITEWMILSSIAAFGPKFLESQFNMSSGSSAIIAGAITIPSGLIGALIGGFLVKKFHLLFRGMIRLCIASLITSFVLMAGFFFSCPSLKFAGVNTQYNDTSLDYGGKFNLISECNSNCSCDTSYNPVCGDNNVMYYSSCHAGCTEKLGKNDDGYQAYSGCECVSANQTVLSDRAVAGKCSAECGYMWGFIVVIFAMALFTFIAVVPTITATIRCVSHSQRAFALGVQSLLYRALGTVPGPIIFGSIIDKSCILWEESCDGARQCWLYNNSEMSINVFILLASLKLGSCIFYILCYFFYRAPPGGDSADSKVGDVKMASDGKVEGVVNTTQSTDF